MPSIKEAVRMLSKPKNTLELKLADYRFRYEDLLYYGCLLESEDRSMPRGSSVIAPDRSAVKKYENSLKYSLTTASKEGDCGQKEAINALLDDIVNGRRVDAILEGDVGCGKTTVAFALMAHMAGNGHQAVRHKESLSADDRRPQKNCFRLHVRCDDSSEQP